MTLFRNFFTVGYLTFISRIFGFIRDVLIASIVGAGFVADAFLLHLNFPIYLEDYLPKVPSMQRLYLFYPMK